MDEDVGSGQRFPLVRFAHLAEHANPRQLRNLGDLLSSQDQFDLLAAPMPICGEERAEMLQPLRGIDPSEIKHKSLGKIHEAQVPLRAFRDAQSDSGYDFRSSYEVKSLVDQITFRAR